MTDNVTPLHVVARIHGDCGAIHPSVEDWQKCEVCQSMNPANRTQNDLPNRTDGDDKDVAFANLLSSVEQLDAGMKTVCGLLADFDRRLRALEMAQRKADRKNVPVIVNAQGERAN